MDERRQKNPVVIYQENKDEELERLREIYQATLEALSDARERIIAQQDKIYELGAADQKIMLLEAESKVAEAQRTQLELALKDSEAQRAAAEQHAQAAEDVAAINAQDAERAKAEAEDLRAKIEQIAAARGFKRRKLLKELTGGKHG